jgi:hypothetical protein
MTASVGRIVHYTLNQADADAINRRRADFTAAESAAGRTGFVGHVGNSASEGDVCAAVVVRTWGYPSVNLQVLLDGTDTYWATSRSEGDGPGHWSWPPRV